MSGGIGTVFWWQWSVNLLLPLGDTLRVQGDAGENGAVKDFQSTLVDLCSFGTGGRENRVVKN